MTRRTYTGPSIDVSFDGEVCEHAAECVRGMSAVFNTAKRPWIDPGVANTPELAGELRAVVARCPSGALRIEEHEETTTPSS